ncbi:MAG: hypothetical protein ABSC37_06895 [Xanthobacteraceae bacterium]
MLLAIPLASKDEGDSTMKRRLLPIRVTLYRYVDIIRQIHMPDVKSRHVKQQIAQQGVLIVLIKESTTVRRPDFVAELFVDSGSDRFRRRGRIIIE